MAVIEYDEYKQKLQALEPTLGELEKALGIRDYLVARGVPAETADGIVFDNARRFFSRAMA